MKKVIISFAVILILLIGALAAIPFLFKDEIISQVKTTANESLTATLDFKDVDISVFRNFPKLSVGLVGLEITGTGAFDGVKLVQCERLDVAIDLWSAIFGQDLSIKGLYFEKPDIRVYVLSDGRANYDIVKPGPETTPETAATASGKIKLEDYGISAGRILYDDRSLDMRLEIDGMEHTGSGEFGADVYDIDMKTAVEHLSVNYGGVKYLSNARADWKTTINADMKNMKFTLRENNMKVNALELDLNGWVALPNDEDIVMNLTFGTPQNTFKSLLSIIPGAYTQDFDGVQANGTVQFDGKVNGKYNETTYPAFDLNFKVGNADFKYPSLPLGVSGINVDAAIKSPGSTLDGMTVNIPAFRLRIGSNPISGYFNLKKPVSDPTIDTKINGTLNLGELSKAFPMEGVQELAGIIKADIVAKAAMSQVDNQQYDQVQMAGDFAMQNISYRAAGTPAVKINSLATHLTPQRVDIREFDARLGKSDIRASGAIDNILAYFSTNKTMRGNLNLNSSYFDANEWLEEPAAAEGTAADPGKVPSDVPAATEKAFDRWDFTVDGKIGKLKYDVYDITDLALNGHFMPNKMDISNFAMKIGGSDLSGNGHILNAWNYLYDNQTVSGVVNLKSSYFDLNQFMTEETAAAPASTSAASAPPASGVIPVPENIDMTLNAQFNEVKYTNLTLQGLDGQVLLKDKAASIKDCTANVLGGQVAVSGEYNTRDLAKPLFNIDLALQNMGFKDAFQNFATVKTMAPVAQLIDGKFNTTVSMAGILGQDMMPDLQTLSAAGFLETISAIFNNFKPLNEIGNKLNVEYLKHFELKNTRNWFEIKDGQVTLKPFNTQMRDVSLQIGGSHSLKNDMSYQILTKTPRKALEKSSVGSAANSGLKMLSSEASKYGVNIAQGEFINVRFDLTGTLFNPKVAMKVLGSDGESSIEESATAAAGAVVEKARDSVVNVANRELDKAKDKALDAADKARDSLARLADKKVQEAKDKAAQEAKDQATKVLGKEAGEKVGEAVGDKVGQKAGEVLGDKGQKKVDDVKDKLDKWDPFKKKKKDN